VDVLGKLSEGLGAGDIHTCSFDVWKDDRRLGIGSDLWEGNGSIVVLPEFALEILKLGLIAKAIRFYRVVRRQGLNGFLVVRSHRWVGTKQRGRRCHHLAQEVLRSGRLQRLQRFRTERPSYVIHQHWHNHARVVRRNAEAKFK